MDRCQFQQDIRWSGPKETTLKQDKNRRKDGNQSMMAERHIIGFVTSAVCTTKDGYLAVGFCHCEALQELFLEASPSQEDCCLALLRNPSSLQYRPVTLALDLSWNDGHLRSRWLLTYNMWLLHMQQPDKSYIGFCAIGVWFIWLHTPPPNFI